MSNRVRTTPTKRRPAAKPKSAAVWHFVCITRLAKVSMLRDMDLDMARQTYQRLKPDTRPKTYIWPKPRADGSVICHSSWARTYGPTDDWLDKVEIIGPPGQELDPWLGVEPIIEDMRSWEVIHEAEIEVAQTKAEAVEAIKNKPWDDSRTDFWNNPDLWEGITDPRKQMCWMPR